jgi:hypothetical protein
MTKPIFWIGLILLLPAALPAQEKLRWHDNYAAARAEARKTGKPLLVEFRCAP